MTKPTSEKALDIALAAALQESPEFATWFLSQTKFKGTEAKCVFVRSDNPWSAVVLDIPNAETGFPEATRFECETDVLAVFQTSDGRRLGVHVENKLGGGSFTPLQPQLYAARLEQWKQRIKLGDYHEGASVLIAPQSFLDRVGDEAKIFGSRISHETLAEVLPSSAFGLPDA